MNLTPENRNNGLTTGTWSDLCRAWAAAGAVERQLLAPLFLIYARSW